MTIKVIHTYDVEHRWTVEYETRQIKIHYLIQLIMFILI